jgi:hypothetical protein
MCRWNTWGMGNSLGRSGERWAEYRRSTHAGRAKISCLLEYGTQRAGVRHWFAVAQIAPKSEVRRIARHAVVGLPQES